MLWIIPFDLIQQDKRRSIKMTFWNFIIFLIFLISGKFENLILYPFVSTGTTEEKWLCKQSASVKERALHSNNCSTLLLFYWLDCCSFSVDLIQYPSPTGCQPHAIIRSEAPCVNTLNLFVTSLTWTRLPLCPVRYSHTGSFVGTLTISISW